MKKITRFIALLLAVLMLGTLTMPVQEALAGCPKKPKVVKKYKNPCSKLSGDQKRATIQSEADKVTTALKANLGDYGYKVIIEERDLWKTARYITKFTIRGEDGDTLLFYQSITTKNCCDYKLLYLWRYDRLSSTYDIPEDIIGDMRDLLDLLSKG